MDGMVNERGVAFLISRFEGGGLLSQPTLRHLAGSFSVRSTLQWMDVLLAALDCYNTFISLHIMKPHLVFGKRKEELPLLSEREITKIFFFLSRIRGEFQLPEGRAFLPE